MNRFPHTEHICKCVEIMPKKPFWTYFINYLIDVLGPQNVIIFISNFSVFMTFHLGRLMFCTDLRYLTNNLKGFRENPSSFKSFIIENLHQSN